MKNRILSHPSKLLLFVLVITASGCMQPDLLPVFENVKPYRDGAAQIHPIEIPEAVQPGFSAGEEINLAETGILDLAVEQAIQLALRNNLDLKIEQLNPLLAGTFERIERGFYDPELFGDLGYSKTETSEASSSAARKSVEENDRSARLGIRQKLPTGTSLEATVEQESTDTNSQPEEQTARVGLSITQSLLRGFGPAVNLIRIRQADINTTLSEYELRGFTEAFLAETENAYWDYVLAGRKIDIFEKSLAIAHQQLDEVQQRIEVGVLPRIEAAAARAEVARREQALINVRSTLEDSRLRLLRLMNPRHKNVFDLQIKATSSANINPLPIDDLGDRLLLAVKARPDLNEARYRLKLNELETIATRNGMLPRLDLFISLGKTGYANSFADSFRNIDGNDHDFFAGLTLSQYINNRQAEGRALAAAVSRRQAAEAVENLKQLVILDVRLAVNEFERARKQIAATQATRLLQEETLKAEKERFDVGASTALQVAQAQRDLLASAIDEVEAVINCRQALVRLYLAEGSLLERRGIRLVGLPWTDR